jgi:hypothetical protein
MPESHPPAPGPFVEPNLEAIVRAVDRFTFPMSKRDMLDRIDENETVLLNGRNVELRTLVRDLNDDFFEDEDEFRGALRTQFLDSEAEFTNTTEDRETPIYSDFTQDLEQPDSRTR